MFTVKDLIVGDKVYRAGYKYAQKEEDKTDIPFVDYYSNMVCISNGDQLSKYTNDGVHPNSQGYEVMESLIKPVIDKVLN